jgi:LPS export ABC transporter protein LptC
MTTHGLVPVSLRLFGAVGLAALTAACSPEIETPLAPPETQAITADNVIFGMVTFITATGVREGRIRADTAFIYADSAVADLRQMQIVFYGEDGRPSATVTGVHGEWNQETEEMVARGDVVLEIHSDSSRIESQEIHYDPGMDRIWSDSSTVRTMSDGAVSSGSSFESDMSFENVLIRDMRGGSRRVF